GETGEGRGERGEGRRETGDGRREKAPERTESSPLSPFPFPPSPFPPPLSCLPSAFSPVSFQPAATSNSGGIPITSCGARDVRSGTKQRVMYSPGSRSTVHQFSTPLAIAPDPPRNLPGGGVVAPGASDARNCSTVTPSSRRTSCPSWTCAPLLVMWNVWVPGVSVGIWKEKSDISIFSVATGGGASTGVPLTTRPRLMPLARCDMPSPSTRKHNITY